MEQGRLYLGGLDQNRIADQASGTAILPYLERCLGLLGNNWEKEGRIMDGLSLQSIPFSLSNQPKKPL